jgi:L-ascorbate metabolism protein UlaG (beta-lactamase superfamily)
MEITWYGLSCFRLAERGSATVVTDPYDGRQDGDSPLKLAADIVTISQETPEYNYLDAIKSMPGIQKVPYVISGPGEYEVSGVFITGIQTGGQKGTEPARETAQAQNTLYVFDFDSLTVAHLGSLERLLTQAEVEAIGTVNVALVPIGQLHNNASRGLNAARAAEVISLLEPNIVVPMHSSNLSLDALSKFLKEMGLSEVAKQPSLKVTSASLPEETQVIVLDHQRG